MLTEIKEKRLPTFIVYFFSYLLIFVVLMMGFYIIFRNQILHKYLHQALETAQGQIDILSSQLENELLYLSKLDNSIVTNTNLISYRYKSDSDHQLQTFQELKKHLSSSPLVQSVIYLPLKSGKPFSTMLNVSYRNNMFYITNGKKESIAFNPIPYLDAVYPQLILLSGENQAYLIYFPVISSRANYIFFYTLDIATINQEFRSVISDSVVSVAIVDNNMRVAAGINTSKLLPYLTTNLSNSQMEDNSRLFENRGILELDAGASLCYHGGISGDYAIICMISNDSLAKHISNAFADTYWVLILLALVGFLLVVFAMRFTFVPLNRLTNKIVPGFDPKKSHLHQLEETLSESSNRNQILSSKLQNYRYSILKSIFDSILPEQTSKTPNIDQFFDPDFQKKIYVIHMSSISGQLDYNALNEHFSRCFPDKDCFLLLKNEVNSAVFLVNDNVNSDSEKPDQHDQTTTKKIGATLSSLLYQIYEELDVMSAISQSSSSPLDIPSLYENALSASEFWPDQPVVFYETLPNRVVSHDYPYSLLQQMKESLEQYDFLKTRYSVDSLFRIIDNQIDTDTGLTEFYIQCILIDMLTNLVNCMNQNYVSFNTYNELYFTTLNLCRSCIYQNNAQEISSNVHALLDICEREIIEKQMTAPFKQVIEECYTKPDFSLSMLADRFHVSSAYMSQWFKLELNCNFSEYLWSLRLNKAQELLRSTNMSIDEISVAVGYMNTSSFRRKYKQETGLTPSQYRTMNSQTT